MDGAGESTSDNALTWVWDLQSTWSQAAGDLKNSLFRARTGALWLTVAAAILATSGVQIAEVSPLWGRILAAASALSVALVTAVQRATGRKRVQDWTRARSVSEGLKAEIFRFMAGVAPYRGEDRVAVFQRNAGRILGDADYLKRVAIGIRPVQRPLPNVSDMSSYITERVSEQIDTYYRPQSEAMKHRADRYRVVINLLAVVALLLGFAATVTGWQQFAAWAPVVTTVIAAVAAHGAANRYDALALEYARTYEQLERLLLERPSDAGPDRQQADDRFVAEAEAVISVQNESWMARSVAAVDGEEGNGGPKQAAAR